MNKLTARLTATTAMLAVAGTLALGLGSTAAGASLGGGFDATCNANRTIRAEAMDLHAYPGYTAVWAPHLFRYTTAGWQPYRWGSTFVQSSSNWDVGSYTFGNLPAGYYQVRDTIGWVYNGRNIGGGGVDLAIRHWVNAAVNTYVGYYSTSSYCYMG
jgi:hypothetical protein